jgi:hypothetical protein
MMRKSHVALLVAGALLALASAATTWAATNPWTKARVQKTVVAKVVIKCPDALIERFQYAGQAGSAQGAVLKQQLCDDPAEPRTPRAWVACGVTPKCQVVSGGKTNTYPVTEELLKEAQTLIYWHDHGKAVDKAICVKTATTRFTCGVTLVREALGIHLQEQGPNIVLCPSVTAKASMFRWKVTDAWWDYAGQPRYQPHCKAPPY